MTGERVRKIVHLDIGAFYASVEPPPAVHFWKVTAPAGRLGCLNA